VAVHAMIVFSGSRTGRFVCKGIIASGMHLFRQAARNIPIEKESRWKYLGLQGAR